MVIVMMMMMKTIFRRANALGLLFLTFSTALTAAMAYPQTRTRLRYTRDLITVNAFFDRDLSTVDLAGARTVARDYRNATTRVKFTMDPSPPNIGFAKATFEPSGEVLGATMTDGPAVARCLFYSSQGESFVSKPFTRLVPLERRHSGTDAAFCYEITPLRSRPQIVLFIDFEDGTQAIVLSELVMGVSSTDFTSKFRRRVDDTGALDVKRIALVEAPHPDTLCSLRLGRYAPDRGFLRFDLDDPLVDPVAGVTAVNCESSKAFEQERQSDYYFR